MTDFITTILEFEAAYACFNAKRTLARLESGSPLWKQIAGGLHIEDKSHPSSLYLNRLVLTPEDSSPVNISKFDYSRVDIVTEIDTPMPDVIKGRFHKEYELIVYGLNPMLDLNLKHPGIEIERLKKSQSLKFLDEVCRSIGKTVDENILEAKKKFYCTDEFRCYFARVDNMIAGVATLFVSGHYGWLANAFTHDGHRRKGVHSSLIHQRILDGRKSNLRYLFTDVVSGSSSQSNIERLGFTGLARSDIWCKGNL